MVGFSGLRVDVMISILDQNYGGYVRRLEEPPGASALETHPGTGGTPKGGPGVLCWCKWSQTRAVCLEQQHDVARRAYGADYMTPIQGRPRRY